jgi:kynurenine formamidase
LSAIVDLSHPIADGLVPYPGLPGPVITDHLTRDGIPIIEHLRGLDRLVGTAFTFTAVPPAIVGMGTFPVRALAQLAG